MPKQTTDSVHRKGQSCTPVHVFHFAKYTQEGEACPPIGENKVARLGQKDRKIDMYSSPTPKPSSAIAAKAPRAVRGSKEMLLYSRDHSVSEGLNYIATWNAGMLSQVDLQAGIEAQMKKKGAVYED